MTQLPGAAAPPQQPAKPQPHKKIVISRELHGGWQFKFSDKIRQRDINLLTITLKREFRRALLRKKREARQASAAAKPQGMTQ